MADSRRELIIAAAVAALGGVGKPAGLSVHRKRMRPMDKDALPSQVVYARPGNEASESINRIDIDADQVERHFWLRVESRAIGDPADAAVDELNNWAEQTLLTDSGLRALVFDIEARAIIWDADEKDKVYALAAEDFLVTYFTSATDPETL